MPFRFEVGDRVRVLTHPMRPLTVVAARWAAEDVGDTHAENVYEVTGFVTRQRESSLAHEGFMPLPLDGLAGWRMTGAGTFHRAGPMAVESDGGPGILWYTRGEFTDFLLLVDWRLSTPEDNSGVFVRIPPLGHGDSPATWALDEGYEVQIDDRGFDPDTGSVGSPRHSTGAIYGRAPVLAGASEPIGRWNTFEIQARGHRIAVCLNGVLVSRYEDGPHGRLRGTIGLQCHHAGSRVQFRNLQVKSLSSGTTGVSKVDRESQVRENPGTGG